MSSNDDTAATASASIAAFFQNTGASLPRIQSKPTLSTRWWVLVISLFMIVGSITLFLILSAHKTT